MLCEPNKDFIEFPDVQLSDTVQSGRILTHRNVSYTRKDLEVLLEWDGQFSSWVPIQPLQAMKHPAISSYLSNLNSSDDCMFNGINPSEFVGLPNRNLSSPHKQPAGKSKTLHSLNTSILITPY